MDPRENDLDEFEDDGRPSPRRRAITIGAGVLVLLVFGAGVAMLLRGDDEPPRKVQDLTVVNVLPPPPPPPPPPPQQPPPEEKIIDQTPVKQEIIEEQPVETPKDEPPKESNNDEPPPGPLALDAEGQGPGDGFNLGGKKGGKGFLGAGGGGGGSRWGWYASLVQSQIESALRANQKTRHAVMRIQVRLWSDQSGRVNRVQLVSSTGNPELDAVIRTEVLGGLTLREPPPKDMPMPIITRVTAHKPT
jgi:outer membrane biosynthesis protein TonB